MAAPTCRVFGCFKKVSHRDTSRTAPPAMPEPRQSRQRSHGYVLARLSHYLGIEPSSCIGLALLPRGTTATQSDSRCNVGAAGWASHIQGSGTVPNAVDACIAVRSRRGVNGQLSCTGAGCRVGPPRLANSGLASASGRRRWRRTHRALTKRSPEAEHNFHEYRGYKSDHYAKPIGNQHARRAENRHNGRRIRQNR